MNQTSAIGKRVTFEKIRNTPRESRRPHVAWGMGHQTYLRMVLTKHVSDIARKEKKKHTS
jgi:deoxyxylulose-5-phosphate synthase